MQNMWCYKRPSNVDLGWVGDHIYVCMQWLRVTKPTAHISLRQNTASPHRVAIWFPSSPRLHATAAKEFPLPAGAVEYGASPFKRSDDRIKRRRLPFEGA